MGAELVEGSDLRVVDGRVQMRTTSGYQPIDVLYRRVDDDFLDPLTFNPDSVLGVPGIMDVYRAGGITIANAPGTGIADDKAIYSFMPDIVEFYTGEKPLLPNVETWRCADPDSLKYVLDNLAELVVKEVHGSGGYGMLIGPTASQEARSPPSATSCRPSRKTTSPSRRCRCRPVRSSPEAGLAPRHVDLRPFVLVSPEGIDITPGRADPRGAQEGFAGGQFEPGRRDQGHWVLRTDGLDDCAGHARPHRQRHLLDVPLSRAGREHRAPARRRLTAWR